MKSLMKEWYQKYHVMHETDAFLFWWYHFYGYPEEYLENKNEQEEYWVRRAFALMGFNAGYNTAKNLKENNHEIS